jgi:hypothetical protein
MEGQKNFPEGKKSLIWGLKILETGESALPVFQNFLVALRLQFNFLALMKRSTFLKFAVCGAMGFVCASCASSRCECGNNRPYRSKNVKVSLLNPPEKTTFALLFEVNQGKSDFFSVY